MNGDDGGELMPGRDVPRLHQQKVANRKQKDILVDLADLQKVRRAAMSAPQHV